MIITTLSASRSSRVLSCRVPSCSDLSFRDKWLNRLFPDKKAGNLRVEDANEAATNEAPMVSQPNFGTACWCWYDPAMKSRQRMEFNTCNTGFIPQVAPTLQRRTWCLSILHSASSPRAISIHALRHIYRISPLPEGWRA